MLTVQFSLSAFCVLLKKTIYKPWQKILIERVYKETDLQKMSNNFLLQYKNAEMHR